MLSGITYNVFLGKNLKELLAWLCAENEPLDFYCFQEFPEDKIGDIAHYLPRSNHNFYFAPGFMWRGVTYGELTVLRTDQLTPLAAKTLYLGGKGEPNLVFIRDGFKFDIRLARFRIDRSALVTAFQYGGHRFLLVNAHLCSDIHNTRKLKQLMRILEHCQAESPAIILGDFNYPVGSGLPKLMGRSGFTGALKRQRTYRFAPGIYWQNDHVFHRGCVIDAVEVKQVRHSDHYPIFFKTAAANIE